MDPVPIPAMPRRATSVSTGLAAHFEQLIRSGELPRGSRLPSERALATEFGVSRTSLREAMRELEDKRLVDRAPGRGTIVCEPPEQISGLRTMFQQLKQDADHASELRLVVEPQIAWIAAERATEADLMQLRLLLFAATENPTPTQSLDADLHFHMALAHAAQNPLLSELLSLTNQWTADLRRHSHDTARGRRTSTEWHRTIYRALEAHDPAAAEKAMRDHLASVRELIASRVEST